MAEEEVVAAASPAPTDHKRKYEDLEPEAPEPPTADPNSNESDAVKHSLEEQEEEEEEEEAAFSGGDSDESEAKRPRLEEKSDGLATENGFREEKVDEPVEEEDAGQPSAESKSESEDAQQPAEEASEMVDKELPSTDDHQTGDIQQPSVENPQLDSAQEQPSGGELQEPSAEVPKLGDVSSEEQQPASDTQTISQKMDVPNNKVGVLIGKAGDTIRFLQINSGAKIQITRDADADPYAATRPVELIGTLENINKAEKLIKDVIAEADAGGSPSLVARGFSTVQAAGAAEQILIQVPNEKVGLIIGKGGETIKQLQTRSGARIQLIPQHLPEGDQSKERTVRVSGDKKQIEMAREMIKEVMDQPVRPAPLPGSYNQQVFRSRGPAAPPQWGPRGPHPQASGYDYQQRGPYPSQNSQYQPQAYGNYTPQQMTQRTSFGPGWEQRPPTMQAPPPQSGGYDYYGGQAHMVDAPLSNPVSAHGPGPSHMGPPTSQGNYNYGQLAPYNQTAPQSYGHGYNEVKYENQASSHHPYGGHGGSQPGAYPESATHSGYAPRDQYGKPPSYGMPPHGPASQSYVQPRSSQPGDVPYQGPVSSTQPYAQNAPAQQTYPYASSGPMQQTYPPYGSSAVATDGYNQMPPATTSAQVYPQQGGQPVSGYGQLGGQQAPSYAQVGATGGYGSYPSSQPGYTEQPAQNYAGYGYQGAADPAYGSGPGSGYGAPPIGQAGYAQPAPTQLGYDQSHSGGYGSVPGGAPVGYVKSLSPQPGYPQYDSTQMYGAPR